MENVKKKRSNLVMPTHYQELTREEMEYVDGGVGFTYYLSNDEVWNAVGEITGFYKTANLAAISSMQTSLIGLCAKGIKSFAFAAKIGAIPVVGLVAIGVLALAATTVAAILVGCLISGKGFGISLTWSPKWYNPFNGINFQMGFK